MLSRDKNARADLSLRFLKWKEEDEPWQILWSDKVRIYLNSVMNNTHKTHNLYGLKKLHTCLQAPLHSQVTKCCSFTASLIISRFFWRSSFKWVRLERTCSVNSDRYADIVENFVITTRQQNGCLNTTIFMIDSAPPQIRVQHILRQCFFRWKNNLP